MKIEKGSNVRMLIFCKKKAQPLWGHLSHICILLCGAIIAVFIVLNFSFLLYNEEFAQKITGAKAVIIAPASAKEISADDMQKIIDLVNNGHVLTQDQFLSTITQFYNSIINILILIISVLGVAAYFSIRASSKNQAEEIAEKYATKTIDSKLENMTYINEAFAKSELFEEFGKSNSSNGQAINELEQRLLAVEYWLMTPPTTNESTTKGDN